MSALLWCPEVGIYLLHNSYTSIIRSSLPSITAHWPLQLQRSPGYTDMQSVLKLLCHKPL